MSQTVEFTPDWPPNWVNVADTGIRSYSGSDSVLIQRGDVLRCAVNNWPSKFVAVFGPLFVVFFTIVCWLGIDEPRHRTVFVTLGLFCGAAAFGLIFALMKHHEARGDYMVVDTANRNVELPRYGRSFDFAKVLCLQLLTGRDKNHDVINDSDLNLIVDDHGDAIRYHLMGNPNREHAQVIADAIGIGLFRQDVPPGWYRSSDRQNSAVQRSPA